jgi:hypothetical protein
MVGGNYNLYLESIDSDPQLSVSRYKKFSINKDTYYDEVLPSFYKETPIDIAFKVKYDEDNDNMFNTFDKQFDDTYQMGCRNIINNKNYNEEFECFAPLYVGSDSFPKKFVIFRIDGPGLISLSRDNFQEEIVNKLKCVKVFDLTRSTPLGEWIDNNFLNNQYYPKSPFYMDFRSLEFSSWNGIDYEVGGYTAKSFFLDSTLEYENTFFDMEKMIYDGYKNNKVVFPNILNLSFLFDDTPATPDELRKWSINRYMGFYMDDMELIDSFSPYSLPPVRTDVSILGGNILISQSNENPFTEDWDNIKNPLVEIDGQFYKVEKYSRTYSPDFFKTKLSKTVYSDEIRQSERDFYKIISDRDLSGLTASSINSNTVLINSDSNGYYIEFVNGYELIPDYDTADVWIIDIDNKYHVIKKIDNKYYLNSDYGFSLSSDRLQYWINNIDPSYRTSILLDPSNNLISFKLYRCKFTDIKDFDTSIVETEFSRYEYENQLRLTNNDEPKLYSTDYDSDINPRSYNDYIIDGKVVNVPCSSEYTANGETFRLVDNELSQLWRKNPVRVKWGYQNSLSSYDYPYLLNNSFLSDDFNRTVNSFNPTPNRIERNMDWFYTINSASASYTYHSLHVENVVDGNIDNNFEFDLSSYININYDYFSYFFGKKSSFNYGSDTFNTNKYSLFEVGDNVIPNSTLFRGLKIELQNVTDIKLSDGVIDNINLSSNNTFQGYKFSTLLSKNDYKIIASQSNLSYGILTPISNNMEWYIIDNWSYNKDYNQGDIVMYQDILYMASTFSNINDPNFNPGNLSSWTPDLSTSTILGYTYSILWGPSQSYSNGNVVYNNGEYYYYQSLNGYTFWIPGKLYFTNDIVIYQGRKWRANTNNIVQPNSSVLRTDVAITDPNPYHWTEVQSDTDWNLVEIWTPTYRYEENGIIKNSQFFATPVYPYCVYNDVLYQFNPIGPTFSSGDVPGTSVLWTRVYGLEPDTNFVYTPISNPIVKLNNRYYVSTSNTDNSTLDSGITIYINKKWKNVLVNIYVNDNTLSNLSNSNRDEIYSDLYSNFTAVNFVKAISDFSEKYGFSDYLQYVIIREDGTINTYKFGDNIFELPYMLTYQAPDVIYSRVQSLSINPISLESSQYKSNRQLDNGNIITIDMINYYNGNKLATTIDRRKDDQELIINYHGLKNNIYNTMYRYSGYYNPIFYNIQLFKAPGLSSSIIGNYKFDTSLTRFGIIKERVMSKINIKDNILKLRFNPDIKSIYPMIDEFGYTFKDYFIFKSTWDNEYYFECLNIDQSDISDISTNKILRAE